jgi:hypothetical protein
MRGSRLRSLGIAVLLALALLVACRQITRHGYAPQPFYRAQVEALLDGRLALTTAPEGLRHDLAWTPGGVQQVWGLGVPAWQLPFEAVGRLIGVAPFPDRVALAAWLAGMLWVLIRAFRPSEGARGWILPVGAVWITALLPGFIALLRGRVEVYEEAEIYSYGAALILLGGLLALHRAPTGLRYVLLLAFAGATGLIRPTVWFYGLATAILATAFLIRAHGRRAARPLVLGAALFVAGGGLLYATNAMRFGRGSEFGHRLNVHSLPGNLVATRFSYPFERIGTAAAAEELLGSLFDRPELRSKRGFYQAHLHRGQAALPRWREYYFTTFSWAYLPALAAGLGLGALAWRRRGDPRARMLLAWAVLGGGPLAVFYLHAPSLSSRYELDLAPALVCLLVIAWCAAATRWPRAALAVLIAAWSIAIATSKISRPRGVSDPIDRDAAAATTAEITHAIAYDRTLPGAYALDDPDLPSWTDVGSEFARCRDAIGAPIDCDAPPVPGDVVVRGHRIGRQWQLERATVLDGLAAIADGPAAAACDAGDDGTDAGDPGADDRAVTTVCRPAPSVQRAATVEQRTLTPPALYLNGTGWDLVTGAIPPASMFYVDDPAYLALELTGPADTDWAHAARVAIGLDHLRLVAVAETADGAQLRFAGAPHPGLQIAFVAFGPDTALDQPRAAVGLRSIRWRDQ